MSFACRTGKCERRAEGRCKYVHDGSKVAVCPGWLAGQCRDAACTLQHAHAPGLMPVCTFFLQVWTMLPFNPDPNALMWLQIAFNLSLSALRWTPPHLRPGLDHALRHCRDCAATHSAHICTSTWTPQRRSARRSCAATAPPGQPAGPSTSQSAWCGTCAPSTPSWQRRLASVLARSPR